MDLTRRAFALGSLGLLAAACGSTPTRHGGPPKPLTRLVQVRSGAARRVALGKLTASDLADAQRAFGVDLLGKTCKAGANTTVSPASAALALGLLTAGARDETEERISEMLHLPRWGDDVVAAYAAQHAHLGRFRDQLQVANRVYSARGNDPAEQTLDDWATGFEAVLTQLDIANHPVEATDIINTDVEKDTAGLIPRLFDDPLPSYITVILVNALHLKADWKQPFEKRHTREVPFTKSSGDTVGVQMMGGALGAYRQAGGWQSITLGYEGDHLEMVAILPAEGAGCGDLTVDRLNALARASSTASGELSMPVLSVGQTHHLLDVLAALGLPVSGNYDGLGLADTIDQVVQKVVLKVDEKGTEAAAATGIAAYPTSAIVSPHPVVLDRPYFLLLQDVETGTPLFLSHIADPSR